MSKDILFGKNTEEQHGQALADFLPNGRVFASKNEEDTNLRNLVLGLGVEFLRQENKMNEIIGEHFPADTDLLIKEWECALGIPDECFEIEDKTIEERREQVVTKLTALGVSTKAGFEALGAELGFNIRVEGGGVFGIFPMQFPAILFNAPNDARFTMVVDFLDPIELNTFTYEFPVVFGDNINNVIICLFERLKPANTDIIYRFNLYN